MNSSLASNSVKNGRFVLSPSISKDATAALANSSAAGSVRPVHAELGEQRVVERGDGVAFGVAGINADARPRRLDPAADRARARQESLRVLGVDPQLDGVPAGHYGIGVEGGGQVGRRQELLLDQVDAGHELGDRVLHLQSRVHLEEVELAARREACGVEQELDGARTAVAHRFAGAYGGLDHARA